MARKLKEKFNLAAKPAGVSDFEFSLRYHFKNPDTRRRIRDTFEYLQLPMPQTIDGFMHGTDGTLIFVNRYGVVLRIEKKDGGAHSSERLDSRYMLQPLAAFDVGDAFIEICPGTGFESDPQRFFSLRATLKKEGLSMCDPGLRNLGRLPVSNAEFPDGVTVIVDRFALRRVSPEVEVAKDELQAAFYAPLREKIAAGDVAGFWAGCADFLRAGKLIAGWNDYTPLFDNKWEGDSPKGLEAQSKARTYDGLFTKPASPAAKNSGPR